MEDGAAPMPPKKSNGRKKAPPVSLASSSSSQTSADEEKKSDGVGPSIPISDAVLDDDLVEKKYHAVRSSDELAVAATSSAAAAITPRSSTIQSNMSLSKKSSQNKSTMAMVKLRIWDPASPSKQFKFITATNILLSANYDKTSSYKQFEQKRTLSIVNEADECEFDSLNGRLGKSNSEKEQGRRRPGDEENQLSLEVGNLVGIHLKATKTSASSKSNLATNSQNLEWKVGNSIQLLHSLNLIPLHKNGLERLLYQIESNHPSLRELILDGMMITTTNPKSLSSHQQPPSLSTSHFEILIEAIGKNSSIKKCSLRYSNANDEIASLFALCLVDNKTMTTLSLKGNDLTSTAAKNFYSVLRSENSTLRVLDLSENDLIDNDVLETLDLFMEQRCVKQMMLAKRMKKKERGVLSGEDGEDEEDCEDDVDYRFGSGGVVGGRGTRGNTVDVTVVCHPGIIDGSFFELQSSGGDFHIMKNSIGSYPQNVETGSEEEGRRYAGGSVCSDITGIGDSVMFPLPSSSRPNSRRNFFDPNYRMTVAPSQASSDSDNSQRQRATTTLNERNNTLFSPSSQYSQSSASTRSRTQSNSDYSDSKAHELEIRRQLATKGQAIGAYAMDVEAPNRQEVRGRRSRVGRTESQRRARLLELSGGDGAANVTGDGGDIIDADIERMEDYEYRNLPMYQKAFGKIGLSGEDKKIERIICFVFSFCCLLLLVTIIMYVAR